MFGLKLNKYEWFSATWKLWVAVCGRGGGGEILIRKINPLPANYDNSRF